MLVAALVLASCGGANDTSDQTPDTADTTSPVPTTDAAATDTDEAFTSDMCAALDQDEPPSDLADLVPPAFADAAQVLMNISSSFSSDESSIAPEFIDQLADPEAEAALAAFADAAEHGCGQSESTDGIRFYAQMSGFAGPPAQPDYCEQLATVLSLEASDADSAVALDVAIDIAPVEHAEVLAVIQVLITAGDRELPDDFDPTQTFVAAGGLGLYAEARCGIADSFATMLFAAAFLSTKDGAPGEQASGIGMAPESANPAAATAALPAGSDLTFEVFEIDLEQDGRYLVSALVPAGWERRERSFGASFGPVENFGFIAELTIDSGCDGLCEVTNWEARLNGPVGYITRYREGSELIVDRPTEGAPGIVMMKPGFDDFVEGIVIRWANWSNEADRYFSCDFRLDNDDIAFADAFVAACEAAQPGWLTGS